MNRCPLIALLLALLSGSLPVRAAENPDAVAVVVGNRGYGSMPEVPYAHRDAEAMARFLREVQGYREGNIITLRDATQGQLEATFGNARNRQGRLRRWVKPEQSDVTVFYSGHGMPAAGDDDALLLPVDADSAAPALNGYSIRMLLDNLADMNARTATVYLDACFSGQSAGGPLLADASGLNVEIRTLPQRTGLTVVTAAQADQVANWDHDSRHGLFSRHLLLGLSGVADTTVLGDGDGAVTLGELAAYLDLEMGHAARRLHGRDQRATIHGQPSTVLASLPADRQPPRSGVADPQARDMKLIALLETLDRGEHALVAREGLALLARIGADAQIERVVHAAILADLRGEAGLKRLARTSRYLRQVDSVPGLRDALNAQLRADLSAVQVTSRGRARYLLDNLPDLERQLGDLPELRLLQAQAFHHLGRFEEARGGYRRWMAATSPTHPQWPRVVNAMKQAEHRLLP